MIELWDKDEFDNDDFMGCLYLNLWKEEQEEEVAGTIRRRDPLTEPKWRDVYSDMGNKFTSGQLLCSCQVFSLENDEEIPMPSLEPVTRKSYIEIIALGIRDMAPFHGVPLQMPFLEFTVYMANPSNE